jgi:non-homologous end joining protein Ku
MKAQPAQRQTNVINLMDALRRSVEGSGAASSGSAKKAPAKARASKAKGKTRKAS